MVDKNTMVYGRLPRISRWTALAAVVAAIVLLPIASVFWLALTPAENIWPHLLATVLPRYAWNTALLVVGVGVLAGAVGAGAAWLTAMYRFPGSGFFNWGLLLPLAVPAYVGAYALVDFFEYAGPVQSALRGLFGFESARDYWFFEVRSPGVAIIVLSAALYPYVYLLVRTALRELSGNAFDVARALGSGPIARFWRVGLPLARPAIAASVAIVMMETVSDFGVVSYFSIQTLTTGIFSTWLDGGNAGGAAQLASVVLIVVFIFMGQEKRGRQKMRFFQTARNSKPIRSEKLTGLKAWLAFALCLVPFTIGFLLPVSVLFGHALGNLQVWFEPELFRALANTIATAGLAAIVTVIGALFLVFGTQSERNFLHGLLGSATTIGYSVPGAVLGVGLLFVLSGADHALADLILDVTGYEVGLLMTGTAFAIVLAYVVRFFAIAQGTIEAGYGRISPSLKMAARSLGKSRGQVLTSVIIPMMKGSFGTALLLVFVDAVKELPATLLLRPFNYHTLATRVYEKASLEQISQAAPPALIVTGLGIVAVIFLARANKSGLARG